MKIQILGTGCRKCQELFANAEQAIKASGVECELQKVEKIEEIISFGVMTTPALVIDGKVISSGKLLSVEEITEFLPKKTSCCCCCEEEKAEAPAPCCCCDGEKKTGSFFKKVITIVLLLFVAGSILYIIDRDNKPAAAKKSEALPADVVKVYYFHGSKRCTTCNNIEKLTREATKDLKKAKFIAINVEEAANEHFVKDFQLVNRTVVMERNGKFEKFDRVWELTGAPEEFTAYIRKGVERLAK